MTRDETGKLAVLWRGDRQARADATPANNRFHRVFEELASVGIHAEPAVYAEEMTDEVRAQLLKVEGVLVWVDPLSGGRNRVALDALLRDVANQGVWVSAHPDVTLKMGVKEVLYRTKQLGWGTDTQLYRTANAFHEEFPRRLRSDGPRVLKQKSWQRRTGRVEGRTRDLNPRMVRPWFIYWRPAAAACRRPWRSRISCDAARRISAPKDASSISRSSRGCRTG